MAEDESDQESERLSEELEALVTPGPLAGLPALLNSQYYCRRFCQVSAAPPPRPAPRPSPPRAGLGCGGDRVPSTPRAGGAVGCRGAGTAVGLEPAPRPLPLSSPPGGGRAAPRRAGVSAEAGLGVSGEGARPAPLPGLVAKKENGGDACSSAVGRPGCWPRVPPARWRGAGLGLAGALAEGKGGRAGKAPPGAGGGTGGGEKEPEACEGGGAPATAGTRFWARPTGTRAVLRAKQLRVASPGLGSWVGGGGKEEEPRKQFP